MGGTEYFIIPNWNNHPLPAVKNVWGVQDFFFVYKVLSVYFIFWGVRARDIARVLCNARIVWQTTWVEITSN